APPLATPHRAMLLPSSQYSEKNRRHIWSAQVPPMDLATSGAASARESSKAVVVGRRTSITVCSLLLLSLLIYACLGPPELFSSTAFPVLQHPFDAVRLLRLVSFASKYVML
ncbi:hypothetical protein BHM03_00009997, partial [Ensete ventricosum]